MIHYKYWILSGLCFLFSGHLNAASPSDNVTSGNINNTLKFFHESPARQSRESGLGLIRGWVCTPGSIQFQIDDRAKQTIVSGLERGDTQTHCGTTQTGYATLMNYNLMSTGEHRIRLYLDGNLFSEERFFVTTLGQEFLTDVSRNITVADFPDSGINTSLSWSEAHQNFVLVQPDQPIVSRPAKVAILSNSRLGREHIGQLVPNDVRINTDRYQVKAVSADNDNYKLSNIEVHDQETGLTELVLPADSTFNIQRRGLPIISAEGEFVVFSNRESAVKELGPTGFMHTVLNDDIYVLDRKNNRVTRVSFDDVPDQYTFHDNLSISSDGQFISYRTLKGTFNGNKGTLNVFNRVTGETVKVAFAGSNMLSASGKLLVFDSKENGLVPKDQNDQTDIFIFSPNTGQTRRLDLDWPASQPVVSSNEHWLSFSIKGASQAAIHNLLTNETILIPRLVYIEKRIHEHIDSVRISEDERYVTYKLTQWFDGGSYGGG